MTQFRPFHALYRDLTTGAIDRRQFISRAAMLGMGAATATLLARVGEAAAAGLPLTDGLAFAAATPMATPASGTANQRRGAGGELKILQWQPPSGLSPHAATGDKDILGACPVLEPLMHVLPDGTIVPNLVAEVPSAANGLLASDLASVTYHLLPGVTWSDGEPFTAEDVVFTWQWVTDEANASTSAGIFASIKSIDAVDDHTAKVTFTAPNPLWYVPHTGTYTGFVYPAHVLKGGGKKANDAFSLKPIGTGPFVVDSFTPNDQVTYSANSNYREPNKPSFSKLLLKGGGDDASAARAVLQTGQFDFAGFLQVEPDVLRSLEKGGKGTLVLGHLTYVEAININFSDPDKEVDGQRSEMHTPNPALTDKAVRQAMAAAIDRETIATKFFFGPPEEPVVSNVFSGVPAIELPTTSWVFDTAQANKILDDAGWKKEGSVRKKNGVALKLSYATTINQVRQKIQAVVKDNLKAIGMELELKQIDGGSFFSSDPGNMQNIAHFYWDLDMYQSGMSSPTPIGLAEQYYAGPGGKNIAQKSNDWSGTNTQRYDNPAYDALLDKARTEIDPRKSAELFIQMNDMIVNDVATIPLVRVADKAAAANTMNAANFALGPFEQSYWNIANWNRVTGH